MLYDIIGYWSELKLDIIREYAIAYSKILAEQRNPSLHTTSMSMRSLVLVNMSQR